MPRDEVKVPGFIADLCLPARAWEVLRRENIKTLSQLRAVADQIERFETIGRKTAKVIRAELARKTSPDRQPSDEGPFLSPWGA
ncbi:DNA-directed RNA polymerase subunit alpha C-terminal domain-containing protein [Microvirga aerophila]|uniref:RNA polymerase alpha subunit C-terminal domain-containing protein n=1 Tax=Microvirga aerophila TaxID=670291 RepID=A0A512C5B8_9HYPH|nr:DNA-directed RNA polymerase subunit alpha C-terminal domain-containing protein [Microvirga aerophila]GEO19416.1 hypothetical protein MAE02_71120 [Microvirga aerophila]